MGWLRRIVAVGVLATIFAADAQAADMPEYAAAAHCRPKSAGAVRVFNSGWYLRGDLGYPLGPDHQRGIGAGVSQSRPTASSATA